MSDADRRMVEYTAQTVVARLLEAIQDEATIDRIVSKWSDSIDKTIGRGLRRFMWYVLIALLGLASVKLGLVDKIAGLLKP